MAFSIKRPDPNRLGYHILVAVIITIAIGAVTMLSLRIFTRHGKEFDMPDFTGQDSKELTQRGKQEGFVFVVNDQMYEDGAIPGTVLKQDPSPGERVKKDRKVYLTIAATDPPTVMMPELRDISLRQAQIMLEAQGLKVDKIIEKPSPYENAVLEVLYRGHSIAAGSEIKMGEKITLVVGKDINELPDSTSASGEQNI